MLRPELPDSLPPYMKEKVIGKVAKSDIDSKTHIKTEDI